MNILFLSAWFPYPPDNGSKIRVYHLLKALGARHQVRLLSFAFGTAQPEAAAELDGFCTDVKAVRRDPHRWSRWAHSLRFLSPTPLVTRPIREMSELVRSTLREHPFDVVIASTKGMADYALSASQVPVRILEEHNATSHQMRERYEQQEAAFQRLRCWVSWQKTWRHEARTLRQFELCTMVSERDRQSTLAMLPGYRGPVEVVPNGVDCEHNHPGLADPQPGTLIFTGSLTYSANLDAMRYYLNEVHPIVHRQVPGVSLTITASVEGVALDGLPLDGEVHLSGYVQDIRPLVCGAAVCIVPLRQGGGTRLKILEAMALGTPVVSTSKGAEGLEVSPGQDILIADEPGQFAAHVARLLQDPALRAHLTSNARRLVEDRYDWKAIGQQFTGLVESVARRKHVS